MNDHSNFIKLISANQGIIFKICNTYCKNKSEREDLAQEIVIRLWSGFAKYKPEFKYSTWMYRIAFNTAIAFYRDGKRLSQTIHFTEKLIDFKEEENLPEKEHAVLLLHQFINELKELDKALMLLYLEDKSYKEIAEILEITETNVATKISRIKEKLKLKFEQHGIR